MRLPPDEIWRHLDALTKPSRSLGQLEELAVRLCSVQQTLQPQTSRRRLALFAADHGVVASGVSAWPADVTRLMIQNILAGGAASTVLARQTSTEATLINVGTLSEISPDGNWCIPYKSCRIRSGTRNLADESALTVDELQQALNVGAQEAQAAAADGIRVVAAGEMGIGNTTSAACLAILLADVPLASAVGRGAGADDKTLSIKRHIVEQAVRRAQTLWDRDPLAAIATVAGLEIAAIAGFYIAAHQAGLTIVVDGYVTSAAALVAQYLVPEVVQSMLGSHQSAEPGHARVLEQLGINPYLEWNMRLGEGTGALLLMPMLDAAAAMVSGMATLQGVGIAPRDLP